MAYGRNRKAATKGRKKGGYSKAPRKSAYRGRSGGAGRRKSGAGKRAATGGRSTVTIRVVQEAPQQLSPLTQQLLDQKKIQLPRRARF